jgi:peptidoglycan/xylan/chitin deacetylase (PgdA/CDA1 family)
MTMFQRTQIPIRDIRHGGPLRHAVEAREQARALRDDCLAWLPPAIRHAMPILDAVTQRWLMRSCSPYRSEIAAISAALGFSGVWFLNGSYQWGCTAYAREADAPWLVRTLDWPFPGLGRHVEIARMAGQAGEYYSVTWPGFVGVLTGMAPGRFAASINQAPMWRRTRHPWMRPVDMMANAAATWPVRHMPPDQLLRHVFETAEDFAGARQLLETTPIARPVIYTLAGCKAGERCIIERTTDGFSTRTEDTGAANDWLVRRHGWEGRIGANIMFTCSHDEAGANSQGRRAALTSWDAPFVGAFDWVTAPVLNLYTRIAVEMCAANGILRVVGYEMMPGFDLPQAVTLPGEVGALAVAA